MNIDLLIGHLAIGQMSLAVDRGISEQILREQGRPEPNPLNDVPVRRCTSRINHDPHFHMKRTPPHAATPTCFWCPGRKDK